MAALRDQLIASFSADQAAVQRYRHHEVVSLVRGPNRETRELSVFFVHGHQVSVTLAENGRAVSAPDLAAERLAAQARAAQLTHRPPPPPGALEFDQHVYSFRKLADDFLYGAPKVTTWRGRPTWVYPAEPNPNVPDRTRAEQVLLSSRGEIWVDARDRRVARIRLHTFAPVRYFLGILATVREASLDLQLAPGADAGLAEAFAGAPAGGDCWLPTRAYFDFDATVFFFKHLHQSKLQVFSDYRPEAAEPRPFG